LISCTLVAKVSSGDSVNQVPGRCASWLENA
jgi:hypothetical protein